MFGIDLDKLLLVGILVGVIVGPTRLREWRRAAPRVVGRMHALYQRGKSEVTRDLDELAPEWREYDPRQLHPRRLLSEIGADVRRATESDDARAASRARAGESPVESSQSRDEDGGGPVAGGVGDDVEDAAGAPAEEALRDLDRRRAIPGDGRRRPYAAAQQGPEDDGSRAASPRPGR